MGSLFKTPEPPKEDPAVAQLRREEQQRAEDQRNKATQDQLGAETRLRSRRNSAANIFGFLGSDRVRSILGSG